ncbi:membrane protein [Spirochaetia bacterium]|nr:membrane protein [Spirochaetia bacterium]
MIKKAIGLSIVFVGIRGALENEHILLLIMSMVAGAIIGELINIDKWMNRAGQWAEKKLGLAPNPAENSAVSKRSFSKGFVSASILFCTGSMAIVGSMQSGLQGNHETLFAKSILDGSISLVFGASLGIGVAFSALPVLLYEGAIVLASLAIRDYLTPEIIREMSAVGSLIIAGIGFNFLSIKEIKVANLIPAIFIPWAYLAIFG